MFINFINKDISHINRIPQVVKENRPAFFAFVSNLCNYVNESTRNIYKIVDNIKPIIAQFVNDYDINLLKTFINKLNIKLVYDLPDSSNEDDQRLLYVTALQGAALTRLSDGSRINLQSLLDTMYPGNTPAQIEDSGSMNYIATIRNYAITTERAVLSKYLQPNITGVSSQINFNVAGYFAAMEVQKSGNTYQENIPDKNEENSSFMWKQIAYQSNNSSYVEKDDDSDDKQSHHTGKWILEIIK